MIGKDPTCDISIADPEAEKRHAEIFRIGEMFFIRDLGSPSGTFVNGKAVSEVLLRFGDEIRIGRTFLRFQEKGTASAAPFIPLPTGSSTLDIQADLSLLRPASAPPSGVEITVDELLEHIARQSHFEQRYRLEEAVYQGGMGVIWSAYDRILGRRVAVKIAKPEYSALPKARAQCLKEAKIGGLLLHPNILPVFDLGVDRKNCIYMTMRFVRGASLGSTLDALNTGCETGMMQFPLKKAIASFVRSCEGVQFAHENGVLHLDLKPDNILMSGFEEVFVTDWGLARVTGEEYAANIHVVEIEKEGGGFYITHCVLQDNDRVSAGTPGYMSPEQWEGQVSALDPRTDVFGLGGILFHILYGTAPCAPPGVPSLQSIREATMGKQRPGKPRAGILPRGERCPEKAESLRALETICRKALERRPGDRHRDVHDLICDVNSWLRSPGF